MKLALFGHGGHAREVARQIKPYKTSIFDKITFYVDPQYANGVSKSILEFDPEKEILMVAIADCKERKRIVDKLPKSTKYLTFIHPTAQIMDEDIEIGEGSFIGANSILTTNIKLGKHSILNRGNHIGHDTKIGDYFSAMPGAIISGNVTIGDEVYVGTNASIKEKINITNNVIIGLNSGIINNIDQKGTYVGLPAKKIK
jgi:sugar O-acyltransferase (sialic acid O-acetyltransferase NeuD family)